MCIHVQLKVYLGLKLQGENNTANTERVLYEARVMKFRNNTIYGPLTSKLSNLLAVRSSFMVIFKLQTQRS